MHAGCLVGSFCNGSNQTTVWLYMYVLSYKPSFSFLTGDGHLYYTRVDVSLEGTWVFILRVHFSLNQFQRESTSVYLRNLPTHTVNNLLQALNNVKSIQFFVVKQKINIIHIMCGHFQNNTLGIMQNTAYLI